MPPDVVYETKISGTRNFVRHGNFAVATSNSRSDDAGRLKDQDSADAQIARTHDSQRGTYSSSNSPVARSGRTGSSTPPFGSPSKSDTPQGKLAIPTLQYYLIQDKGAHDLARAQLTYERLRRANDPNVPCYNIAVMRAGIMYNQAKRQHGPVNRQLAATMAAACLKVSLHNDWNTFSAHNLTPFKVLEALRAEAMTKTLTFNTGCWKGKSNTIKDFVLMKREEGYMPVVPVFLDMLEFNIQAIQAIQQNRIRSASSENEENLMALNFSELWALNVIFTMTDYDDPSTTLPFSLPEAYSLDLPVWQKAIELAQLSRNQRNQVKRARELLQGQKAELDNSDEHLRQICSLLFARAYDADTTDFAILETIEHLRKNQLYRRSIVTEAGFVLLFKILSPKQAAMFYGYIQTQSEHPIAHFMDWMCHLYTFMCGEVESKWIDMYPSTGSDRPRSSPSTAMLAR